MTIPCLTHFILSTCIFFFFLLLKHRKAQCCSLLYQKISLESSPVSLTGKLMFLFRPLSIALLFQTSHGRAVMFYAWFFKFSRQASHIWSITCVLLALSV